MRAYREILLKHIAPIWHQTKIDNFVSQIAKRLAVTQQDIINEFLDYNLNVHADKGNAVYEPLVNRFVLHIHNLLDGSWHIDRQAVVSEMVQSAHPATMADIGFGVPSQYTKQLVLGKKNIKLTFFDLYDSAFIFAENLLTLWDENWRQHISLQKTDMNTKEYIGDFDLYLLQDAIEHTTDPKGYLSMLINKSRPQAKFIISLPIGPIFPRHYMAWKSDAEAEEWLKKCGLKIEQQQNVYVNPDIDLFAKQLSPDYHDLYALCSKQKSN
ncbi:MAG: hypothetical protein KAT71_06420 [Gammaproteobacteria bacterium]|nr:hypothetical protein [Gammaproteobacteria bacterium]